MLKKKHLKLNMLLNAANGMLSIIFPAITFPYVLKILGLTNIGRFDFANSIIAYGMLIAALGIKTYAVREGGKLRDSKNSFQNFANQMFTLNMISTIVAYLLLTIIIIIVPKFAAYKTILFILSLKILFTTLGVDWIYTIYEDFTYITVLSLTSHIISLVLMFSLIHTENDLNMYAGIVVLASVGSSIINFIHSRKYCRIQIVRDICWQQHMKPILILFSMQIATTIYISSDTTILGFICNDNVVGIYSVSTKIYAIIKTILSSIIIVSIPRLASLLGEQTRNHFAFVARDIYCTLLTMVVPAIVGIIMLRKQLILMISNKSYFAATTPLAILSVALLFSLCAYFWGQCVLVLMKMESFVFKSTLISAVVNITLNFILIPTWEENAAAFTTLVAEAVAFATQWWKGKKYIQFYGMWKCFIKIAIGCFGIIAVGIFFRPFEENTILYTLVVMVVSVIVYGIIEVILKNEAVSSITAFARRKK